MTLFHNVIQYVTVLYLLSFVVTLNIQNFDGKGLMHNFMITVSTAVLNTEPSRLPAASALCITFHHGIGIIAVVLRCSLLLNVIAWCTATLVKIA